MTEDRSGPGRPAVVDTHMHVWANDARRYPVPHPYAPDFAYEDVPHEATLEMLIDDMDRGGVSHAVLVQVIYHGWDNAYVADCARRFPDRLRAHGLIDPSDPRVADRLEFWVKEHGLAGMRFSPIYYLDGQHGGDAWLTSDAHHELWKRAAGLGSVFNFFISTRQLPRLETMLARHPDVPVCIDHVSQIDLTVDDPEPEFRRLLALAKHPSVHVKISELTSVSGAEYPFASALPWVKRVHEAFGPDRLLWGTGYPGAARAAYGRPTLTDELKLVREHLPFLDEQDRHKILGENAARIWTL